MNQPIEIGPLQITVGDEKVVFQFTDPMAMTLEIPPSFEEHLRDVAEDNKDIFVGKSMHMELGNVAAISSRQLGMMLTIREVIKPFGKLQLHNLSGSVKHLLELTGTQRFFDIRDGAPGPSGE